MLAPALKTFIEGLPKAELHIHIEGSLEPELMFALAARNGLRLDFDSVAELRRAYTFADLQSFLDIYYEGARVLVQAEDYFDLAWAYLEKARAQNVRHAEIFFDPQTHTNRGIPFETILSGLDRALIRGREKLGLSTKLIMCFLRHLGPEAAMQTLACALPYREIITAVGLDSTEVGYPPELFTAVFDRARKAGFLTVAHAGEEGPAAYVEQALRLLKVARIDHGVRCLEDKDLVADLVRRQVPLTVCPLSNVKLGVFDNLSRHTVKALVDRGLCVTINSDDPAYFGGYINDNYMAVCEAFGLTRQDLKRFAQNSFKAAFIEEDIRQIYLDELDRYVAASEPD
jgi:adenine deaminase